jgi:hypothetical protein
MASQRQDEFAPFEALYEWYARFFDGEPSAVPFDFDDQRVVSRSLFRAIDAIESPLRNRGMFLRADARYGLATIAISWVVDPRLARGDGDLDKLAADAVNAMRLVVDRAHPEDGAITLRALTAAIVENWNDLKDTIWR